MSDQNDQPVQILKLADDLMPSVADGSKRVTVRYGKRDVMLGRLLFQATKETHDPLLVEVLRVEHCKLIEIPWWALHGDGFPSVQALMDGLRRFYPDIGLQSDVTCIEFEHLLVE